MLFLCKSRQKTNLALLYDALHTFLNVAKKQIKNTTYHLDEISLPSIKSPHCAGFLVWSCLHFCQRLSQVGVKVNGVIFNGINTNKRRIGDKYGSYRYRAYNYTSDTKS